ncbi:MAG TPA: histidine kinase [Gemmatimonadales bacterium]|nr:histidine kinase [Gemmatimonadales bacterium]
MRRMTLPRVLLIGATVLGVLVSAQHWAVMQLDNVPTDWKTVAHALRKELPFWYLWVLLAPIVVIAVRKVPLIRGRLTWAIPAHVLIALVTVLIHAALQLFIYRETGFPTQPGSFWSIYRGAILFRVTLGLLGYTLLFAVVMAAEYYDRFRERERAAAALSVQLAEARLAALRMQLNPHFLFNTLNTVAMQVRRGENTDAVRMLAGLSDILRHVLEDSPPQEVTVRQELAFIDRYLAIERSRFGDRLRVTVDVEPDALDALVPNLVLQPLVENAIRHGIGKRAAAGKLDIRVQHRAGMLELAVQDDGPGLDDESDSVTPATGIPLSSGGIGLRNTASRLQALYGEAGKFTLESSPEGGAIARVVLPWHLMRSAETIETIEATETIETIV